MTASSYVLFWSDTFVVLSELSSCVIKERLDDGSENVGSAELVLNVHVLSVVELGPVIARGMVSYQLRRGIVGIGLLTSDGEGRG